MNAGRAPDAARIAEARERFDRALELYREGDYTLALVELRRAYELTDNYRVLYNIGQVSIQLGNYAVARAALEEYLVRAGPEASVAQRNAVARDLRLLLQRTGFLSINVNVPGARVLVNDVLVGNTPLRKPLLVNAGFHRIVVKHPDYLPEAQQVTLAGGDQEVLSIKLQQTEPTKLRGAAAGGFDALLVGAWVTTGALAAGAIFTGVMGIGKAGELEELRKQDEDEVPDLASQLDEARSSARMFLLVSDILSGAAIAMGGVGLWLSLRSSPSSEPSAESGAELRVGFERGQFKLMAGF